MRLADLLLLLRRLGRLLALLNNRKAQLVENLKGHMRSLRTVIFFNSSETSLREVSLVDRRVLTQMSQACIGIAKSLSVHTPTACQQVKAIKS